LKSKQIQKFKDTEIGKIPEDWDIFELQQVSKIIDSLHISPNYSNEGISMVRATDIKSGNLNLKNTFKVTVKNYEKFTKNHKPQKNDVVMSRVGTYFPNSFIDTDEPFCLGQNTVVIHPSINPRFLYYALNTRFVQAQIEENLGGSGGQKTISLESIKRLLIPVPKNSIISSKIAKFLSELDSKIEILRNVNETLEKITQSLFKSWFADFDGQTEFIDSELGQIPKGWEIGKLGQLAKNIKNSIPPSEINSDLYYIGLEHMPKGFISLLEWEGAENIMSNKFQFNNKQILFGKLRPYFKKVGFAPIDGICSTDILVIDSIESYSFVYVLEILCSDIFINYTSMGSTGTRMPRTDWKIMSEYNIVIPPKSILLKFNTITNSFLEDIRNNIFQIKELEKIRDSLLPKLMSGEIRV
jgi:type I restriction enzyme S subunit